MTSKKLINSILFSVSTLVVIILFNCDGSNHIKKTTTQVLKENNMLESFSEHITYVPQSYAERHTDTILNTGYRIQVKTFADMHSNYLKEDVKNQLHHKTYFRNFKASITVSDNNTEIFKQTISKVFIEKMLVPETTKLEDYILKEVWLDDSNLNSTDTIIINILYSQAENPKTHKTFQLYISKNGAFYLKAIQNTL